MTKLHMEDLRRWGPWAVRRPWRSVGHGLAPLAFSFGLGTSLWALLSLDADMAQVKSVCFTGGSSNPCDARVAVLDWMTSCSLD